jgi:hypothetical protein
MLSIIGKEMISEDDLFFLVAPLLVNDNEVVVGIEAECRTHD